MPGMGTFGNTTPGVAGSDLSLEVYKFVKWSAGKIALAGAGDVPIGVLHNKPKADEPCNVFAIDGGTTKVITDNSAIAVGSPVKVGANGKVTLATSGNAAHGIAEEANGSVDGSVITIQLNTHTVV